MARVQFRRGVLTPAEDRDLALAPDTVIVSDGDVYDPADPASISAIRVPAFDSRIVMAVLDLSYTIKLKCGVVEDREVIVPFIDKTLELMLASPIHWRRGDYLQVIRNYYRLGMTEEGNAYEAGFRRTYSPIFMDRFDKDDEGAHLTTKYYFEEKNRKADEYAALQEIVPELLPDTLKGYLQIRTRGTAKFGKIREKAEAQGFVFKMDESLHYCEKYDRDVIMEIIYEDDPRYVLQADPKKKPVKRLKSVKCKQCKKLVCNGENSFGLSCEFRRR